MRTAPLATLLITALCLVGTASAADESPPTVPEALKLQQRARAQMRNIEYELAIPLLSHAQTAADLNAHQKAEIEADLGICQASLGDTQAARTAFESALKADPLLDLPVGTSPKIRQLFETTRSQLAEARPASPMGAVVERSGPAFKVKTLDYALMGVAVAGVGAGIATALVSSRAASDLEGSLHDRAGGDSLSSRQRAFGTISVISYSVAGAAAITSLVRMLWWNNRPEPASAVAFSGSVSPTGASASLRVSF